MANAISRHELEDFREKVEKDPKIIKKYENGIIRGLAKEEKNLINQISLLNLQNDDLNKELGSLNSQISEEQYRIENIQREKDVILKRVLRLTDSLSGVQQEILEEAAKEYYKEQEEKEDDEAVDVITDLILDIIFPPIIAISKVLGLVGIDLHKIIKRSILLGCGCLMLCWCSMFLFLLAVIGSLLGSSNTDENVKFVAENGLGENLFDSYNCASIDSFSARGGDGVNQCE